MTYPGNTAGLESLGARPARDAAPSGCKRCRHPRALHSNGKTACRAGSCTAGPGGTPCPEFEETRPEEKLTVPLLEDRLAS